MINIRTIKIKNQAYYRADFRYAPTGFNNTDWEQKSDELVAAGLLPKTKQLTINKSKMTKKEVREKCAALINNVFSSITSLIHNPFLVITAKYFPSEV